MKPFPLTVSTPDGAVFSEDVVKLDVRGSEGELAVMAGHAPFVTTLKEAPVILWKDDATAIKAYSKGGILTVGEHRVILLSSAFSFE